MNAVRMNTGRPRHRTFVSATLTLIAAFGTGWLLARSVTMTSAAMLSTSALTEISAPSPTPVTTTALGDAQRPPSPFTTWTLVLETEGDEAIAAWQVRIDLKGATAVGLEGGAAPFAEPPHYDADALSQGHLVLAAYTLAPPDADERRAHVATLHLQLHPQPQPDAEPSADIVVEAAATVDGTPIPARATLVRRTDR